MPGKSQVPVSSLVRLYLAATIAIFSLAGRATGHIGMAAWIEGTTTMKDTTAWIILEHTAIGFLICRRDRRDFGAQVLLVAAITFFMAFGLAREICTLDDLSKFNPQKSFFPSIITVGSGVLLALKALAAHYLASPKWANILGGVVTATGVSVLLGYGMRIPFLYFYIPGLTTAVAVNTAVALLLVGSVIVPNADF